MESRVGETYAGSRFFFNFKVALKKLRLRDNLHGEYTTWAEEFKNDEQFDYVIETKESHVGVQSFKMVSFELDPVIDIILVKVSGEFDMSHQYGIDHAQLMMSLQLSSSDVTYLPVEHKIRSVVSDDPNKYKIFEFYVNELQFPKQALDGVDLFITLTPCSGLLKFFISDDYSKLF